MKHVFLLARRACWVTNDDKWWRRRRLLSATAVEKSRAARNGGYFKLRAASRPAATRLTRRLCFGALNKWPQGAANEEAESTSVRARARMSKVNFFAHF